MHQSQNAHVYPKNVEIPYGGGGGGDFHPSLDHSVPSNVCLHPPPLFPPFLSRGCMLTPVRNMAEYRRYIGLGLRFGLRAGKCDDF